MSIGQINNGFCVRSSQSGISIFGVSYSFYKYRFTTHSITQCNGGLKCWPFRASILIFSPAGASYV
jgi:hypothetical protein